MKINADQQFQLTQIATWKFTLYLGLGFVLLFMMFSYENLRFPAQVVETFIERYQPGARLFQGQTNPIAVALSIGCLSVGAGAFLAVLADLATWCMSRIKGTRSRFWLDSAFQHLSIVFCCVLIFAVLIV